MRITDSIKYVGVDDKEIDLFEGQYEVPLGMAYNSYVIIDEKIAVMDSVEVGFKDQWIENIKAVLGDRAPDYLIVQHMEPDHSSGIMGFLSAFPNATVVGSAKAFNMMGGFFGTELADRRLVVGDGDSLSLGGRSLKFFTAPMVHWPEVIVSYDEREGVLFSADAFGKFGANDIEDEWACEARRYYFGIVGKYGAQVQALLKKLGGLKINIICSLHGPVLSENIDYYIDLYNTWSSYRPEEEGVCIAYASIYGNTGKAARLLYDMLTERGVKASLNDLARCDMHEAVEDAFRYDRLVLASATYNADVFPFMKQFIDHLTERNFQNRTVGFIENGSWAPAAARVMKGMLQSSKNLTLLSTEVRISSALNEDNKAMLCALAEELCNI